MSRIRTSPIWTIEKEKLVQMIDESSSITEVLEKLDLCPHSGNHRTLYDRCNYDDIDLIELKNKPKPKRVYTRVAIDLDKVLIEHSTYSRNHLKKRLLQDGLLANECSNCKLPPSWDNQSLVMILDHINGVNNDNRLENLRLLCPNCNSQTKTFGGRKNKKQRKCQDCGSVLTSIKQRCDACNGIYRATLATSKKPLPPKAELKMLLNQKTTWKELGQIYGASLPTLKKWANYYDLKYPVRPRGIILDIACETCGEMFHPKGQTTKYCSRKCMTKAQQRYQRPTKKQFDDAYDRNNDAKELASLFKVPVREIYRWVAKDLLE